ncbi:unnamed protein product [Brugia timori]|uniref:Late transcription factor VLTF-4 n=1 Tax=Brugia timori TaxID=42155 RepID=A0A0R3QXN2_9BILA|nr:unnamed protein product [Brugia timori]
MPGKKKSIISGMGPKMPPSFLDNLSDFSSDDESQQQPEQPEQPQPQNTPTMSTEQSPQAPTVPTNESMPVTPEQQSVEQTSDSPQMPTPSYDIAQLLDEIAANVREINVKVNQYNSLMEKTHEYLKLRYRDVLTDENMDTLKMFLINICSTNNPYASPLLPGKHKLQDTGEKKIEYFFHNGENSNFPAIPIDNIVIQPVDSITSPTTINHEKSIQIKENGPTNDPQNIITLYFKTWLQFVHLRDILCLKLSLLRKYRIYAKTIFDRLVNHLATMESSEVDVLQLPTDRIYKHRYLTVNIEHFDIHLCQLLDAEIRTFMANSIRKSARNLQETRAISFTTFHPFI